MDRLEPLALISSGRERRTRRSTYTAPQTLRRKHPRRVLLALSLLSLLAPVARAANISVCASGCDQTSVAASIAAANSGDTITIGAGTYPFNVEISKNLTLQGSGSASTILDGGALGTAMVVDAGTTVTLQGVTVKNGGSKLFASWGIVAYGNLNVSDSLITGNQVGIYNVGGVVNVLRTTLSNNYGDDFGFGGAIENTDNGYTILVDSAVIGNYSEVLGGIGILNGTVSLQNSTVSGNRGGVVQNIGAYNPGGLLSLTNSTVVNDAGAGSISMGFTDTSQVAMNNTILSSPGGSNCQSYTTILSLGHNLSSDNTCGLSDPTDKNNNANLGLGPLQVNSPGTTATYALQPGSAAIDAGDCSLTGVSEDQRGVSRPQGPACDIGAYELRTPIAVNDAYVAMQGQTMTLAAPGILSNDVSPDGLSLSVATASSAAHGTLALYANGGLQYLPNLGFTGLDTVTYTVGDGAHLSNPASLIFNVTAANTPPIALNDTYSVVEGQVLTANAAHGFLANDTDADGDPIVVASYSQPANGTVVASPDGSFVYTPKAGFYGGDIFTYQATDGHSPSAPATVTITVTPNFGTITIAVDAQPLTTRSFSFTGTLGKFTLGGTNPVSKIFQVGAGSFSVIESLPKPWLMANIVCSTVAGTVVNLTQSNLQVALADGENITCTFVDQLPGQITVQAFNDINGNGTHQNGEALLRGITTQMFTFPTAPIASETTDSSGKAVFANLQSRVYTVCAVLPAGYTPTNPPTADPVYGKPCFTVNLPPGQNVSLVFGMRK